MVVVAAVHCKYCKTNIFSAPVKKPGAGRGRKKSQDWKKKKKQEEIDSEEETDQEPELFLREAGDHEYLAMKEVLKNSIAHIMHFLSQSTSSSISFISAPFATSK